MKKRLLFLASAILIAAFLAVTVLSASAAVYVQDGKFKYQIFNDGTAALAGYISETVDDVVVPRYYDTYKIIGVTNFALENNSSVRTIDFMEAPDIEKIGMYAFHNCSSLESVLVPNSITYVDVGAFRDSGALENATFFGNDNVVPVECFYNCSSLKNVRLSASLKSIQSRAFAGCSSLEYVEISDTVTYIASNAFDGADNVTLGVFYGSYAHQYAVDNEIDYYLIDGEPIEPTTGEATPDEPTTVEPTDEPTTVEPTEESTTAEPTTVEPTEPTTGEITTIEPTEPATTLPASPDEPALVLGDINGDGIIDVLDATLVQKAAAEKIILTPAQINAADVNHDGFVDVLDALIIQKYSVGKAVIE